MGSVANINEVLADHVALEVECIDRLLLNAYVPSLQVGGQVARFITGHLGKPIASAAVLGAIGNRFRRDVRRYADANQIPVLRLKAPDRSRWDDRKLDHVRPYLQAAERERRYGGSWRSSRAKSTSGSSAPATVPRRPARSGLSSSASGAASASTTSTSWTRTSDRASSSSAPTSRIRPGSGSTATSGASARPTTPASTTRHCRTGSRHALRPSSCRPSATASRPAMSRRSLIAGWRAFPTPLSADDRAAGYWWQLSIRQVEISRTLVFDDPRRARSFFEALVADNIGIGRPEQVSMVFARPLRRPAKTTYGTRVFTTGTDVRIDFRYKHCRIKQYLKDGRALRIETVINNPSDLDVRRRLEHLGELVAKARQVNQRLLIMERAGQSCAIGSALFERLHLPYDREGHRTGALRFGDTRAMALAGALCHQLHAVAG